MIEEIRQGGFVKLPRFILDSPLSPNAFAIYGFLLLSASYKSGSVAYCTTLKKGQVIKKNKDIEEHFDLSPRAVRTALDKLIKIGLIEIKTTNKFTVITICNYCDFGEEEIDERQTKDKQKTNERQA